IEYTSTWSNKEKAAAELTQLYKLKELQKEQIDELHRQKKLTPQEIKKEVIDELIDKLTHGYFEDSLSLYQNIIQIIELKIKKQIEADTVSEAEELLDL
ncbi:MAG: hypothetical protein K2J72_12175, partial [Oscillospiraceae bacterium]|nr:hypothetical protein [Oscillospiraceae bacterium]